MRWSPESRIHLPLILIWALFGACAPPKADYLSDDPYFTFFGSSILGPDVAEYLASHGIHCLDAGHDLGGVDWVVQGRPATRFRARALVLAQVRDAGWMVSWPADTIVLMNEWAKIGFEMGPWVRLASVEHRSTPTETILDLLERVEIPALFLFGETSDLVLVKSKDASAAASFLRAAQDPAVVLHNPKTCTHLPPPFIRKGTPTILTLSLSGTHSKCPLGERVADLICSYSLPGRERIEGHTMISEQRADGTLVATYELPALPPEATGVVEYSFSFTLDGRTYWHGSPGEDFRVPLK